MQCFLAVMSDMWPPCVRVTVVRSPVLQIGTLFIITADSPATVGRFVLFVLSFSFLSCGSTSYISRRGCILSKQMLDKLVLEWVAILENVKIPKTEWACLMKLKVVSHFGKMWGIDPSIIHKNSLKTIHCLCVAERKIWTMQSEYQRWESARYSS